MTKRPDTAEHAKLKRLINYFPATGEFTAAVPTTRKGRGERIGTLREDGSYIVSYGGQLYTASRLAWYWMTGEWPERPVRLKTKEYSVHDYRWSNLELTPAPQSQP